MDIYKETTHTNPSNQDNYYNLVREALDAIESVAKDNPEAAEYLIIKLIRALYSNSNSSFN